MMLLHSIAVTAVLIYSIGLLGLGFTISNDWYNPLVFLYVLMGKSGFGLAGFFIYGLTVTSVVNGH